MPLSTCATSLRAPLLAAFLAAFAMVAPGSAHAQAPDTSAASVAWVPTERTTHHEPRRPALIAGVALFGVGYVGSLVWGTYYLASLNLGVLGCNDLYGGFQFLPLAGPLLGMFTGGACIPDHLHVEEAILPVLFTGFQLAGVIALIIGAAGREVPDLPRLGLQLGNDGGVLRERR